MFHGGNCNYKLSLLTVVGLTVKEDASYCFVSGGNSANSFTTPAVDSTEGVYNISHIIPD